MTLLDRVKEGRLSTQDMNDRPRLIKTLEYLERQNIEPLMQSLLAELLEDMPEDPRNFLASKLKSRKLNSLFIYCRCMNAVVLVG